MSEMTKSKSVSSRKLSDLLTVPEDEGDEDEDGQDLDDMRSNIFPKHNAHWLVMNPLLDWRLSWDIFMMVLIVFVMLVTPFELAFISSSPFKKNFADKTWDKGQVYGNKRTGLWFCNMAVNFGFIIDICFNFFTAVYDEKKKEWLLQLDQIALAYTKSWFLLDIVSILPIEYMAGSEAKIIRLLRLFRLFKLAKVLKSEKLVDRVAKHIDMSTKMQTIIKYCIFLLVMVHWSACALRLVADYNLSDCDMAGDDCPKTVLGETGNWGEGVWAIYVEACLWALIALNGEADAITHTEAVLGLFIMLMGVIILAFLVGDMSNIMSNLDPVANEFKQTLDNLNDYMAKSGFPNPLRLKLREYIMLSEPVYRDHFNKEMLSKLSPTLIAIVARQNLGRVVNRIPFYAYTIQSVYGYKKGVRVNVKCDNPDYDKSTALALPESDRPKEFIVKAGTIVDSPQLLKYDVEFDDGTFEPRIKHTRIIASRDPKNRLIIYKLNFQRDLFVAKVAHLFSTQLFMTFDVVIHKDLSLNDVMYVIDTGKICCLNYDHRKQYGICVKKDNEFFGDDIAMLACGDMEKKLRQYSAHATAITQMHALDAGEFIDLLNTEPALSLFAKHFKVWGCWMRLQRCFNLHTPTELVDIARTAGEATELSAEGPSLLMEAADPTLAIEAPDIIESLTTSDTAALMGLISKAVQHGLQDIPDAPAATPEVLDKLRGLVTALRRT